MIVLKLIAAVIALAFLGVAAFLADLSWNDGGLFYAAMGRDELVSRCTPLVRDDLEHRGFSPADLALGGRPSISMVTGALGRARTLSSRFTFSDGPDGPRVDGRVVCVVEGRTVRVEVDVEALPRRAV